MRLLISDRLSEKPSLTAGDEPVVVPEDGEVAADAVALGAQVLDLALGILDPVERGGVHQNQRPLAQAKLAPGTQVEDGVLAAGSRAEARLRRVAQRRVVGEAGL